MFGLALPVQAYVAWDYYIGGAKALLNRSANMDVLVAMGSSVAFLYSLAVTIALGMGASFGTHVYFETAAVIITLIKLGKLLEARAKGKINAALKKLPQLSPKIACRLESGEEHHIPIEQVGIGDGPPCPSPVKVSLLMVWYAAAKARLMKVSSPEKACP